MTVKKCGQNQPHFEDISGIMSLLHNLNFIYSVGHSTSPYTHKSMFVYLRHNIEKTRVFYEEKD
ncbi:hypothetical protein AC062_2457 [Pasteurellaceae bacterium NI1060]|nr:hypothetical protein AC062_2457 [Pasteurellaceae bacterium NI1060]